MYTKRAVESQRVLLASLFFSVICPEETVRDGSYRWWSEWRSSDTAFGEISTSFSQKFIYTVLMCFTMVLWMSIYNVTLHMGALNLTTIREAWIGFPIAYVFAMCMDWFVVSGPAKGFAFRFLVKPESPVPWWFRWSSSCPCTARLRDVWKAEISAPYRSSGSQTFRKTSWWHFRSSSSSQDRLSARCSAGRFRKGLC